MSTQPAPRPLRIYRALALVLIGAVVIQLALAGLGVFGAAGWGWHQRFGSVVEVVPLIAFLVTLFGRLRGSLRWIPLLAVGLVALQHLTAAIGGAAGAIHAVNALAVFGLAIRMHQLATTLLEAGDRPRIPPFGRGRRGTRGAAAALLLAVTLVGCDDGEGDAAPELGANTRSVVVVTSNEFTPRALTVEVGDTVTWRFEQGAHDVVFEDEGSEVQTDGTWRRTFDEAGSYDYECTLHPGMAGRVEVT